MHNMLNCLNKKRHCERGFSLIEAMVALAIFVIGILGVYKLQLYATTGNALANRVTTSQSWASYAVEELLTRDYDHDDLEDDDTNGINGLDTINNTADGILYISSNGSKSTAPGTNDIYTVYWNIADGTPPSTILNDVKQIRVHVVRNGGIGNGLLYSHDYYKAKWPESE